MNITKSFLLVILVFSMIFQENCGKDSGILPMSKFDYYQPKNGIDVKIVFFNECQDATSFMWDFGDGSSSTDVYPLHSYNENGIYKVTLTAYLDTKQNTSFNYVTINYGKVVFYLSKLDSGSVRIYPDQESYNSHCWQQEISVCYPQTPPDCGDGGCFTYTSIPGDYTFYGETRGWHYFTGQYHIIASQCTKIKVH